VILSTLFNSFYDFSRSNKRREQLGYLQYVRICIGWSDVTKSMVAIAYDRHFVGITWHKRAKIYPVIQIKNNQFG